VCAGWMVLDGALQDVEGGVGVGHRGSGVRVEQGGQVQRVAAGDQGLGEDAVAADVFELDAAQQQVLLEVEVADGLQVERGVRGDEQVRVGGARPGGAAVLEPVEQDLADEVAQAWRCRRW
jgi:hypothetical protein